MRVLALAVAVLALGLAGCGSLGCWEQQPPTPGEDVRMGTFTGTQVIDEPGREHGSSEFVDGWKEGREQLWYANGKPKVDAQWRHGRIAGDYRRWAEDGKLEAEQVFDGQTGRTTVREWHSNGQLRMSGARVDGRADGLWQWWFDDGSKICEGHFHADLKEGPWKCWNSDGSLDEASSGIYRNGMRAGPLPGSDLPH